MLTHISIVFHTQYLNAWAHSLAVSPREKCAEDVRWGGNERSVIMRRLKDLPLPSALLRSRRWMVWWRRVRTHTDDLLLAGFGSVRARDSRETGDLRQKRNDWQLLRDAVLSCPWALFHSSSLFSLFFFLNRSVTGAHSGSDSEVWLKKRIASVEYPPHRTGTKTEWERKRETESKSFRM